MQPYKLKAGAAFADITPQDPHFLHGYPFVERISTGTHDPLLSSALYLTDGETQALFISNDVIYISKDSAERIRSAIFSKTGIPVFNIMIAATHTHSGPVTVDCVASESDPVVPKADKKYLDYLERGAIEAGCNAFENAVPAEIAFKTGDATGVGTNRHDPEGPRDMEVPIMIVRNADKDYIACMLVCSMHPTILHEDSTLYSSDFPYFVREVLQQEVLGDRCPIIYFTGTAGNQSPRHVTKANTFEEASRIGKIIADTVKLQLSENISYTGNSQISVLQMLTDLPRRRFPTVEWAEQHRNITKERFEDLRKNGGNPREIRTAEVDWFGSEELLYLSKLAQSASLETIYERCLPGEIQIIKIGGWKFISWPGEVFVEFGLHLKSLYRNIALITYANGELQGYITTKEAHEKGFYEAGNSFFDHRAGDILMNKTIQLLERLDK
jgi:hypothetical protein